MAEKLDRKAEKRKREDKIDSALDLILNKLQKLEDKVKEIDERDLSSRQDGQSERSSLSTDESSSSEDDVSVDNNKTIAQVHQPEDGNDEQQKVSVEIDEETQQLLGDDPVPKDVKTLKVHPDLVSRIPNWIKNGIGEKFKENLLAKFPKEGDLSLIAPKMNQEIAVKLQENASKRDNHFRDMQQLIGSALSATASASTLILNGEADSQEIRISMVGATQILAELFYATSTARKAFVTPGYDKKTQNLLNESVTGEWLFGDKLGERVKDFKAVESVALELKPQEKEKKNQAKSGSLNSRSSTGRKETNQSNYKKQNSRAFVSTRSKSQSAHKSSTQSTRFKSRSQHQRRN